MIDLSLRAAVIANRLTRPLQACISYCSDRCHRITNRHDLREEGLILLRASEFSAGLLGTMCLGGTW